MNIVDKARLILDQVRSQAGPSVQDSTESRPPAVPPVQVEPADQGIQVIPVHPLPDEPVPIRPRILDEDVIWLVPNGWPERMDGPTYTHRELQELQRREVSPEDMKKIHAVKMMFDGELVKTKEPSGDLPPWPLHLRKWWDRDPQNPTLEEVVGFIKWATVAAARLDEVSVTSRKRKAEIEIKRRRAIFDALPLELKNQAATEAAKASGGKAKTTSTTFPERSWSEEPDRSPYVYTLPNPEGKGYVARRWGQPQPVGCGSTEWDAKENFFDKEEALASQHAV